METVELHANKRLYRPRELCARYNVVLSTLQTWERSGRLECVRTPGGHRRYIVPTESGVESGVERVWYCYCRVSSASQKPDLDRQVELMRSLYPGHVVLSDTGSGLNFKRKGLQTLVDAAVRGSLGGVVVSHRDRLSRLAYGLLEDLFRRHSGAEIVVLHPNSDASPESELVEDVLAVLTVFTSRVHGRRSHRIRRELKQRLNFQEAQEAASQTEDDPNATLPDA